MDTPFKHLVLQGNMDAAGFQILNLNLEGLNLTPNSVGLGNVNNTSDANKPVSTAQAIAIALREPAISVGTTDQFLIGDKTWLDYGALALLDGDTGLPLLSSRGANATSAATLQSERNDFGTSGVATWLQHYGASHAGSILGISSANAGLLEFHGGAFGFIKSNNTAPLVFGYNNIRRMRLMTGLNVGGETDPGIGCIEASDTIIADHFEGDDLALTAGASFGGNITVVGSAALQGAVTTTLGVNVGQNLAVGGNLAVVGTLVNLANIPTSNPAVNGQLWRSGNDLKISTG